VPDGSDDLLFAWKGHQEQEASRALKQRVVSHEGDNWDVPKGPSWGRATKSKEMVGNYANGGVEWGPKGTPRRTNVHDFADPELAKAVPYGVDDVTANTGWVNVGTDAGTGQFAVESIRRLWNAVGTTDYADATRVLISADSRVQREPARRLRLWKTELARFAAEIDHRGIDHRPPPSQDPSTVPFEEDAVVRWSPTSRQARRCSVHHVRGH
jgi:hypothetical protein